MKIKGPKGTRDFYPDEMARRRYLHDAWRRVSPGVYIANARAELSAFETDAGVDLLPDDLDEDVDTLGGLVFMLSNRIPERGEVITHPEGHEFEVVEADPRRIKRLRVTLGSAARLTTEAAE